MLKKQVYNVGSDVTDVYSKSVEFLSYILRYYRKFKLEKEINMLQRIDAEWIENYSPIHRMHIRNINKKYFAKGKFIQFMDLEHMVEMLVNLTKTKEIIPSSSKVWIK